MDVPAGVTQPAHCKPNLSEVHTPFSSLNVMTKEGFQAVRFEWENDK